MRITWRSRPSDVRLVVGMAFLGCAVCMTGPAQAAEDPPDAPKLVLVGPTELSVELDRVPDSPGNWSGETKIVVANAGTADAELEMTAVINGGDRNCRDKDVALQGGGATQTVDAGSSVPMIVTLVAATGCSGTSGTLLLEADGSPPVAATFDLVREAESVNYWRPFIGAGVVAALVAAILAFVRRHGLSNSVPTGPSWSFKDSWLTNLAALGAILGTVLAATGFVAEVLPGVATERLVGLNLVFGAMVLAAPVLYAATSKWGWVAEPSADNPKRVLQSQGRTWGLILSGAVTTWGVVGELMTLLTLNAASDANLTARVVVGALIVIGIIVVVSYAVLWTHGVTTPDPAPAEDAGPAVFADREISGAL